jgi:hypothetical protein
MQSSKRSFNSAWERFGVAYQNPGWLAYDDDEEPWVNLGIVVYLADENFYPTWALFVNGGMDDKLYAIIGEPGNYRKEFVEGSPLEEEDMIKDLIHVGSVRSEDLERLDEYMIHWSEVKNETLGDDDNGGPQYCSQDFVLESLELLVRTGLLDANHPAYRKGIDMALLVYYHVVVNQGQVEEDQDTDKDMVEGEDGEGEGDEEEEAHDLNNPRVQAFFRGLGMDWALPQ